jgi:hypothetical protein
LLAGGLIRSVSTREFDVCLEVTRESFLQVLVIFKFSSLLSFDFLVDIVS